jgi:hypothetical protein
MRVIMRNGAKIRRNLIRAFIYAGNSATPLLSKHTLPQLQGAIGRVSRLEALTLLHSAQVQTRLRASLWSLTTIISGVSNSSISSS